MKQTAAKGAAIVDVPEPAPPGPSEIVVRTIATSICGTDFHVYEWDAWSSRRVKPPRIMGHEFAGEVVAVGTDVRGFSVGDYVSGESHWVCGMCLQCRNGQKHVCRETKILGVDVDGCFAEYVKVPEASAWKNDPSVPPEFACIQDPLGNAVHATLAGEIVGRTVAVLGCGPIGIFAVAVARAAGASRVVATDTRVYRLELAKQLGADDVVDVTRTDPEAFCNDLTHGNGMDVVLEMSGAPIAIQQAMRIARYGGRVSLMGIPAGPVTLNVAEDMIFRGLDIQCIVGRRLYETWDTMSALLSSGKLDIRPAITHILGFEEVDHGMDLMREGACGKVVFRM
jgi:threonine 3-dehydrogenase